MSAHVLDTGTLHRDPVARTAKTEGAEGSAWSRSPGGPRDDLPFDGGLDEVIDLHHDEN
jgi:hypothetical protein